jgi:hypothetical protein
MRSLARRSDGLRPFIRVIQPPLLRVTLPVNISLFARILFFLKLVEPPFS